MIMSTPSSPINKGALSPFNRNKLNMSQRIKSSGSVVSTASSREFINIRARPILIDDGKPTFGDFNYEIRPTYYTKPRQVYIKKGITNSWLDIETKKKSGVPDPGKYTIIEKTVNKMKFLKAKRVTVFQEVIKQNSWKLAPGAHFKDRPNTGNLKRSRGLMEAKGSRVGYIEDAIAHGQMSPSHQYKRDSNLTQARPLYGNFSKGSKRGSLYNRKFLAKDYKHVEAFQKTQAKNRV